MKQAVVSSLRYNTVLSLTLLEASGRRHGTAVRAYQGYLVVSLYAPGLGADPACRASVCAHPARRGRAAAQPCGDPGGSAHAEFHDLFSAAVVGLALQEASQAYDGNNAAQTGRETRPSRASPSVFTPHDGAGTDACALCVWQHHLCSDHPVPYAS